MPALCLAFSVLVLAAEADQGGREEFYRALRTAQDGRHLAAVEALEELQRRHPDAPYAAEALSEAARLCEEELYLPERALGLYRLLLEKYPSSRKAGRARARADFLSAHLDQGGPVLAEYLKIQRQAGALPPAQSAGAMIELLKTHPAFSLVPQGKIWAASLYGRAGENDRARRLLWEVARESPGSQPAAQALIELANLALAQGRTGEAEAAYRSLAAEGKQWELAAQGGLEQVRRLRLRRLIPAAGWALWLAGLLWLWVGFILRLRSTPPPVNLRTPAEAWIYLAVMLPIMVLAATGSQHTSRSVFLLVLATLLLVLPNGWWWRLRPRANVLLLLGRLGGLVLACVGGAVAAVAASGLYEDLWHTIAFGPE